MDFNSYWAAPLVYTILLVILYINDAIAKRLNTAVERAFRLMTLWVIFFCLQDMVWGFCDCGYIASDSFFFAISTVFHLSTVITTFFWLYFVLAYLQVSTKKRNLLLALDGIIVLIQVVMLVTNLFAPTVFSIIDGHYVTHYLRNVAFINQCVV